MIFERSGQFITKSSQSH